MGEKRRDTALELCRAPAAHRDKRVTPTPVDTPVGVRVQRNRYHINI